MCELCDCVIAFVLALTRIPIFPPLPHNNSFNDDATFNENVQFDSDADCMPIYNSTSKQCNIRNNYTFLEEVVFENNTLFEDEVKFHDIVRFEKDGDVLLDKNMNVRHHSTVKFLDESELIMKDRSIFKIEEDVDVDVYAYAHFYDDVKIDHELKVYGHCYIDDDVHVAGNVDIDGYLDVDHEARFRSVVKTYDGIIAKKGITVETGKLNVLVDGAHIYGDVTMFNNAYVKGTLYYDLLTITGNAIVDGSLTVNGGTSSTTALRVNGKAQITEDVDVAKELRSGTLAVGGNAVFNSDVVVYGIVKAEGLDGIIIPTDPAVVDIDIIIQQFFLIIQDSILNVGGINIGTEPALTKTAFLDDMKSSSLEVHDLKTLTLVVEESATVNNEPILTTSDAVPETEIVAASTTTATTTTTAQCGCSADEIIDAVEGRETLRLNNVVFDSAQRWIDDATSPKSVALQDDLDDLETKVTNLESGTAGTTTATTTDAGCTCTASDVEGLGPYIEDVVGNLGITGGGGGCSCAVSDITGGDFDSAVLDVVGSMVDSAVDTAVNGMSCACDCNCNDSDLRG
jgi:cytoskeletal protein CcmA (bactofilin family)